ncbi:MAG TPA: aminotransferase class V-fold PLP-dependent enzyme, partial [Vicinamibacterales bacterium]|nr:aminotransferase class V-fold PLP-dependent enzyme [Vicinamibacterales bacterium]
QLRDEMERHPSRFMLRELSGEMPMPWRSQSRLREAVAVVAPFVGARPDDLVFVQNVTVGMNAVLNSIPLAAGDEVVVTDLAYGAVTLATKAYCARAGAKAVMARVGFPVRSSGAVVEAIIGALSSRTKLVVIDHITAQSALVLPVADIAAECHRRGVPVLVDGAHAPGSRRLDIASLGVDWYAANLHKWAHAPRGCGFLWAAADRQEMLHSPIVSWGRDRGFLHEFEHVPTGDPTAYLSSPEGIALLEEWDFDGCVRYMHGLAWRAGELLTDRWRTRLDTPRDMVGSMIAVPLPEASGRTEEDSVRLRLALLVEDGIEVQLHAWEQRLWTRVSLQIYNDESDIARLGDAVARRLPT